MNNERSFLKRHWRIFVASILAVLLIYMVYYFVHSLRSSYSQGVLRPDYPYTEQVTVQSRAVQALPLAPAHVEPSITSIQSWMTFDYLNVVFRMPSDYFKNLLGINDSRYPNIRIDSYARESHIDQHVLLDTIKHYISVYKDQ